MGAVNDFSAIMAKKDNIELVRITTLERNDYRPEAIIAAEEELNKRNISPSVYQDYTVKAEEAIVEENNIERMKQELPLATWIKIIAFIFPIFLFFIVGVGLIMLKYKTRGKELCKWTLFGFLFYLVIGILILLFLR